MDSIGAKGDGGGGKNWSHKMCKTPVKMSPLTNKRPVFLQAYSFKALKTASVMVDQCRWWQNKV